MLFLFIIVIKTRCKGTYYSYIISIFAPNIRIVYEEKFYYLSIYSHFGLWPRLLTFGRTETSFVLHLLNRSLDDDAPKKMYANFPAGIHSMYIGEVINAWKK